MVTILSFDTSTLLGYYQAKLSASAAALSSQSAAHGSSSSATAASAKKDATANDVTPWSVKAKSDQARDAEVLSLDKFIDESDVPLSAGIAGDTKTEQDNQKLFALYKAVNNLSYLAVMAKRDETTDGQMAGYNTRFQAGLQEIQDYIASEAFNNFTLQAQEPSSSVVSSAGVASATFDYTGSNLVNGVNVSSALPGLSASGSFTVSIAKGGVTQDIEIDLSQVPGDLSIGNIVGYVNQQLAAAGYATRFKKVLTDGTVDAATTAAQAKQQYAIEIAPGGTEQVTLSAAATAPSLYVAATSGLTAATADSSVDNQGHLVKLVNLADPAAEFSRNVSPTGGNTTAASTVVDASGNVYMLGNATGDFGSQLNQGEQDVYLSKYDSAGNLVWTKLLGSAGTADGAAMALGPNGSVTIVGSTDAKLTATAVADGNQDSFVTRFDAEGNLVWTTQIPTLNTNKATAVSVDASGNVYIGGQTTGVIGSGQTKIGGADAYVAKLDTKGKLVYEQQFGTTADDAVSATALTDSGDLLVASVQNGHAILSKYAGGDATQAAVWTMDMGDLQYGGAITGLAVSGGNIYISGTTRNTALNATVAAASSGGTDAFVFAATDNGASVTADHVSYLGTSANEKGSALTVGSDGTIYLAGTTAGTFAGQVRNTADTSNMFVAAVSGSGSVNWVRQYGGLDGQSVGQGIAFDANGGSVLDALGLPAGRISGQQNASLTAATTLRAGDTFKVEIEGDSGRTFTIAIDKSETLGSLVTKLNAQLGSKGKASVAYSANGASLKIEVSAGVTAKLIAGPEDLDALGRLGIEAQTLSKASTNTSASTSSTASSSSTSKSAYALGFTGLDLDISTTTGAGAARAQLLNVLSAIQKIYQSTNTAASSSDTTGNTSGTASAYTQSQISNYSLALNILSGTSSSTSLYG
jgi:hypothetical protein